MELLIIEPESSNVNSLDLYNEEKTQRTKRKQSKREVFLSKKETLQNSFNVVSKLKKRKFSQLPDAYKGNRQDTDEADCVNHEIKRFKKLNLDSFY